MFPVELIPRFTRQLLLDGLGRLIQHLAGLSEEVRHGLIRVISRSVSESIESTLHGASRRQNRPSSESECIEPESPANAEKAIDRHTFEDANEPDHHDADLPGPVRERLECLLSTARMTHSANSWWLTTAAGLCGLASWFGFTGLTPLARATSILAGSILVFLG